MTVTTDQKYQLTIPQRKLSHVPGFSHSGEKQVCITHISHYPLKSLQLTAKKNHLHPQKQSSSPSSLQNQAKTMKSLLQKTLPEGPTITRPNPIASLQSSSAPCTLTYAHHLLSHILQESLPSQQRWISSREVSNFLWVPLSRCKILPHFAHYIISI